MKLCVSMTAENAPRCIEFVRACDAELIEHRMDFMCKIEDLDEIYGASSAPIIATCRSLGNGGHYKGSEQDRIGHLLEGIDAGASYVDVEVETEAELFERVKKRAKSLNRRLIASKHYQSFTPEYCELASMRDRMLIQNPDIIKIVTTPSSIDDCRRIMHLYDAEHNNRHSLIAFAMGRLGRLSRLYALLMGAPFMYVSMDNQRRAAPGQMSLSQMRKIVKVLL